VLVVDDDVTMRMLLEIALDAVEVAEGWRATGTVEQVSDLRPDALVLDRRLPDGDGLDVVRAVRRAGPAGALPIVVVTADDDPGLRTAAFDAGADEHLVKPVAPEDLLAVVEALLALDDDRRQVRRTLHRARLRAGRDDGGWTDVLPPPPDPEHETPPAGLLRRLLRAS